MTTSSLRTARRRRITAGLLVGTLALPLLAGAAGAQEPGGGGPRSALGLYGFSARGGVDLTDDGQAVVSVALDVGHLFTQRLRVRPSADLGFLGGDNTYLASFEMVYRVLDDREVAVPYLGAGMGIWGREACGDDPSCPGLWLQFVLGFEVRIRDNISWLMEYHPVDVFRRHRIMIGLTTRRGR
jgi:hypothetical protein